jgi:ABC transporter substrate binding protein (PQQ-dependent alcohol dehydrogenase system)
MSATDWAAWMSVKSVIEAMQRTNGVEFKKIASYLRSPEITIDGFKGNRQSFRPWDNQLRQPLLYATHNAVVERAPFDGFLHQTNKLDTLGFDAPDSQCKM